PPTRPRPGHRPPPTLATRFSYWCQEDARAPALGKRDLPPRRLRATNCSPDDSPHAIRCKPPRQSRTIRASWLRRSRRFLSRRIDNGLPVLPESAVRSYRFRALTASRKCEETVPARILPDDA